MLYTHGYVFGVAEGLLYFYDVDDIDGGDIW